MVCLHCSLQTLNTSAAFSGLTVVIRDKSRGADRWVALCREAGWTALDVEVKLPLKSLKHVVIIDSDTDF